MYNEVDGNLITLAKQGAFDVITHGCNCFSNMKSGIAPQMALAFGVNNPLNYDLEHPDTAGDINKLGQIQFRKILISHSGLIIRAWDENANGHFLYVGNSYTQYSPNVSLKPLDYEALTLCMRKINNNFKGLHVGLPRIGAGLAGGDWDRIKTIIQNELNKCDVSIVNYKP